MEAFLASTKQKLADDSAVHVVIGNEACDLDSSVCAVVYAFYLAQKSENDVIVPVLNINQEDYRLRTEVTFYLSKHGISEEMLIFRDNLDLHSKHKQGKLTVTLVDCNIFCGDDLTLEDCVVEVIDHHQNERQEKPGVSVTHELVGSCCTLVAEKLLADSSFSMDNGIASLLYGTIVLDTVCLAPEAARTTPKDEKVVAKFEEMLSEVDRKKLFDELQTAKADVSGLSTIDVLRKDLKKITGKGMSIAMSSIPLKLETFLASDGVPQDVALFADQQDVDAVVLMTLYITEDGAAHRQIAVFSQNDTVRDEVLYFKVIFVEFFISICSWISLE